MVLCMSAMPGVMYLLHYSAVLVKSDQKSNNGLEASQKREDV